jgi:hypothetical protein
MTDRPKFSKYRLSTDVFSNKMEAESRSIDMGFDQTSHAYNVDGQAYYMPAASHEAYMSHFSNPDDLDPEYPTPDKMEVMTEALSAVVDAIMDSIMKGYVTKADYQGSQVTLNKPRRTEGGAKKFEVFVMDGDKVKKVTFGDPNMEIRRDDAAARASFRARHSCDTKKDKTTAGYWSCRMWEASTSVSEVTKELKADILKVDVDERIVWGWAYVSTVKGVRSVDHSEESVSPEVLVKAATNFMLSVRTAKAMHQGDSVGEVVHSFPLTNELGKSLGVSSDREGWIICMKIHDEKVWQSVKSGELSAFSIGGRALRRSLE